MSDLGSRLDMGWEKGALLESFLILRKALQPSKLVVLTDDLLLIKETLRSLKDCPLILVTNQKISRPLKEGRHIKIKRLPRPLSGGLEILRQTEDRILSLCAEGSVDANDRVLCLVSADISSIFTFTAERVGILELFSKIGVVNIQVLQTVMRLATKIVTEGREGHPAGALFVVGDSENVTRKENTTPLIINPFHGHDEKHRNILNDENWNTILQFATLDGATLIDERGYVISAGAYIIPLMEMYLMGLGSRHLAAVTITKKTKAIGVLVSSSGVISVFKDGDEIYRDQSMTRIARYTGRNERMGEVKG